MEMNFAQYASIVFDIAYSRVKHLTLVQTYLHNHLKISVLKFTAFTHVSVDRFS